MRILFIGHEASRSGAPISLLRIIEYLKENLDDFSCEIMLVKGGPLVEEYKKFGRVINLNRVDNPYLWKNRIKNRVRRHLLPKFIKKYYKNYFDNFDLIFVNSSASLRFLDEIDFSTQTKKIIRVPELPFSINLLCREGEFERNIHKFEHVITGSEIARDSLIENFQIAQDKISVVYGAINSDSFSKEEFNLRSELKIPVDSFIIGGSGRPNWGKGFDIFIQVCKEIVKRNRKIYFVWLGKDGEDGYLQQCLHDIEKLDLYNHLHIISHTQNPEIYYKNFDVFFLSSRVDTFPLVVLENASFEKPVICFDKSGGATEFAVLGGGIVVPYLDVDEVKNQILGFYNDREFLQKMGLQARKTLADFTIEMSGTRVLEIIQKVMEKNNSI